MTKAVNLTIFSKAIPSLVHAVDRHKHVRVCVISDESLPSSLSQWTCNVLGVDCAFGWSCQMRMSIQEIVGRILMLRTKGEVSRKGFHKVGQDTIG